MSIAVDAARPPTDAPPLLPRTQAVLTQLQAHTADDGVACVNLETIAATLGVCRRTAQRAVRDLKRAGALRVTRRGREVARYHLL